MIPLKYHCELNPIERVGLVKAILPCIHKLGLRKPRIINAVIRVIFLMCRFKFLKKHISKNVFTVQGSEMYVPSEVPL